MPRGVQTLEQQDQLKQKGKMGPLNRNGETRLPMSSRLFSPPSSSPSTSPASVPGSGDCYRSPLTIKSGHDGLLEAVSEVAARSPNVVGIPVRSTKWSPSNSPSSPRKDMASGSKLTSLQGPNRSATFPTLRAQERLIWKRKTGLLTNSYPTDSRHPNSISHQSQARLSLDESFQKQSNSIDDKINRTGLKYAALKKASTPARCYPSASRADAEEESGQIADDEDDDNKPLVPTIQPEIQPAHLIGFVNQGNTCYLNASLQALLGLPMLVTDAINASYILRQLPGCSLDLQLARAFFQLAALRETKAGLQKAERQRVMKAVENVKRRLEAANPRFLGNRMQDANEFLCFLMDSINTETEKLTAELSKEELPPLPNLVTNNFAYVREEVSRCLGCGHLTTSRQPDTEMWCTVPSPPLPSEEEPQVVPQLPLPGGSLGAESRSSSSAGQPSSPVLVKQASWPPVGLDTLVRNNFKDEERERRCENCNHDKAQTKIQLVKLPKVLVLHLKRYDAQSRKISRAVHIPERLNLGPMSVPGVLLPDTQTAPRFQLASEPPTPVKEPPPGSPSNVQRSRSLDDSLDGICRLPTPLKTPPPPNTPLRTPCKFRGKTEKEITEMSEEDQVEYLTHVSRKELFTANNSSSSQVAEGENEEQQQISTTPTISRKRSHSTDSPQREWKQLRFDENGSGNSTLIPGPRTLGEEEEDLKKALELSRQEFDFCRLDEEREIAASEPEMPAQISDGDRPGLNYKLVSIVSHYGSSSNAGHYVADVFRFHVKKWFRYDDTVVTETLENFVRNNKNGYIMMYVWEGLVDKYLDTDAAAAPSSGLS